MLSAAFAVLMTIFLVTFLMNGFSEEQAVEGLRRNAELIASGMEQCGGRYLDETEFDEGLRVTWISDSGKVIFDSVKDPQLMEDHSDRQEVRDALENGKLFLHDNAFRSELRIEADRRQCHKGIGISSLHDSADVEYALDDSSYPCGGGAVFGRSGNDNIKKDSTSHQ